MMTKGRTYSFLFLGNSYTYYNQLWDMFQKVCESAGYPVTVDHVNCRYLDELLDSQFECCEQFEERLSTQKYDYVFLQEQSLRPILNYDLFENAVTAISQKINKNGASCVLYQTWGRKTGSPDLTANNLTNESMTQYLAESYQKAGNKHSIPVSHAGDAFYRVYTSHPEIELYFPDNTHPTAAGTYLAALCHFATVTREHTLAVMYNCEFKEDEAALLKKAADEAVFGA